MSLLSTLARLQAVRSGRAEPLATVRHRHLSERPMVVVPLAAAGESGAPLAVLLGTDREAPVLRFVPQPLNRTQRFEFLADFAAELLPYLESFGAGVELIEGSEKDPETGEKRPVVRELCADAPQLIVPNSGSVQHLALLGRSTRFRRTAEDADPGPYPAPRQVPLLGRWLTHLTERAQVPGSSLLLPMTGLLARHWATGQSGLEDQHLAAQLAWHAPPEGLGGAEAAELAESQRDARGMLLHPPAGPATDPRFDELVLAPAIDRHDAAVAAVAALRAAGLAEKRPGLERHPAGEELSDADSLATAKSLPAAEEPPTAESPATAKSLPAREELSGAEGLAASQELSSAEHRATAEELSTAEGLAAAERRRAAAYEALRSALAEVLLPTWRDVWRGVDLLRGLPAAGHLAERWEGDRWSYTGHRDRLAAGEPPQPIRDDAVTAARKLAQREREQNRLDVQEALDDPLAMAEHRLAGEAFSGEVVAVVPEYDTSGRSPKPRPLLTVRTQDRPHADVGREVHRAGAATAQKAEIVAAGGGEVTVRVLSGMGRKKEPEPGTLPEPGETVVFTLFELAPRQSAPLPEPEDTPWTHGGPPGSAPAGVAGAEEWQ